MKRIFIYLPLVILCFLGTVTAQEPGELRYLDENGDGINDVFRDADGDGINDVNGKGYRHRFSFEDTNGDTINDQFRDADGNGINDFIERPESGISVNIKHYVIDYDGDGINDVTGEKYVRKLSIRSFVDEDGDGIDDRETWSPIRLLMDRLSDGGDAGKGLILDSIDGPAMDRFIDEDGDGINDGRTFNRAPLDESIER